MVAATCAPGADSAFEQLFVTEYARAVSLAFRITRDRAEAEDVAQETFVRFARMRNPPYECASAWLYRAVVNAALNAVRSRRRRDSRERRAILLQRAFAVERTHALDPADMVARDEEAVAVRRAMARIRLREAEILALRYGGLSYREIAQTIAIDERQIGTRLARAERSFQREIQRGTHQ